MALSANTVWEVRTGGSDTNGGGFVAGASGTDWSQQNSPQYSVTDAVANGTTTVTSATANFGTDVVGNIAYIGGAWYEITARASATSITVDRTITAASGLTLKIGGALASPGQAGAIKVRGNDVYIKAGTYTISSGSANVSGGCVSDTTGGFETTNHSHWVGYDTTRSLTNTDSNRPLLQVAASGVTFATVFAMSGEKSYVRNIQVDGQSKTSIRGFNLNANYSEMSRCVAENCTNNGFIMQASASALRGCRAAGCSTQPAFLINGSGCSALWCVAENGTSPGFRFGANGGFAVHCVADSVSTGFFLDIFQETCINCTAFGCSGDGFNAPGAWMLQAINCVSYGNGGWGFRNTSGNAQGVVLQSCAAGNNTSGNFSNIGFNIDSITLTADPFTDAAGGDFSLNDAAGGGALLKGTGYPQTMPVV